MSETVTKTNYPSGLIQKALKKIQDAAGNGTDKDVQDSIREACLTLVGISEDDSVSKSFKVKALKAAKEMMASLVSDEAVDDAQEMERDFYGRARERKEIARDSLGRVCKALDDNSNDRDFYGRQRGRRGPSEEELARRQQWLLQGRKKG